jgi:predicted Zn-dependent protease
MLPRSTIAILLLTIAGTAQSGIDLTPAVSEYISEGIKYQKLIFRHGEQGVEYNPPPGWKFHGRPDQLLLTPPNKNFAEAVIESVPLLAPQPREEAVSKALAQEVITKLPPDSQLVTVVSEEQNPVLLNGNRSFEVTVSYQVMGEKFFRSVIFANLPDTQLIFRLTARKDDFQLLHREFRTSISSWHWAESATSAEATFR